MASRCEHLHRLIPWPQENRLKSESVNHSVVSDSLRPHGLQPARLLCPWNSPGKNPGVRSHSLLQGTFPTQGSNPGLLHWRQILYYLSHQEPACQAWDIIDSSPIPELGRSPGGGHGNPLQYSWEGEFSLFWRIPQIEEPTDRGCGRLHLQVTWVGHNWKDLACKYRQFPEICGVWVCMFLCLCVYLAWWSGRGGRKDAWSQRSLTFAWIPQMGK